ncbi:MAG: ABC transporter ATP-binding protein [Bacillota bacterium]
MLSSKLEVKGLTIPPLFYNLSFQLNAGEWKLISGPSGTGKSTLLHYLINYWQPPAGTIWFNGRDITTIDPISLRHEMVLVPQRFFLFRGTVAENLQKPLLWRGKSFSWSTARDLLAELGLPEIAAEQRAELLSGGQQQRLALARALLLEPEVLLLDEPTSAQDEDNSLRVEKIIRRYCARGGACLWISHDPRQLERMGNVLHLKQGGVFHE